METGSLLGYLDVSRITGIPRATLYWMVHQRTIPHVRLGARSVRFKREQIERWIDSRSVNAKA